MGKNHQEAADTPLAHALRFVGVTQEQLAAQLGIGQPAISRAVRHCRCSLELAAKIMDAIDPDRELLDERHVLYARLLPDRYGVWREPGVSREAFLGGRSAFSASN